MVFGLTLQAGGATAIVDWLEFSPGSPSSSFTLRDDTGTSLSSGLLTVRRGVSFAGFPSARSFADAYWEADTGLVNSLTGDSSVSGMAFRVAAAAGGPADYTIEFLIPEGQEILLMVGDLYRGSDTSRTAGVGVSVHYDGGSAPLSLEGMWAWDNGISRMSETLSWDSGTGVLSTVSGESGESMAAFFRIAPVMGENARIVLTVPDGLSGTGDAIMVALGVVVPEPSTVFLAALGSTGLLIRRRR